MTKAMKRSVGLVNATMESFTYSSVFYFKNNVLIVAGAKVETIILWLANPTPKVPTPNK